MRPFPSWAPWALFLLAAGFGGVSWLWIPPAFPVLLKVLLWFLFNAAAAGLAALAAAWVRAGGAPSRAHGRAQPPGEAAGPLIESVVQGLAHGLLVVDRRQQILFCNEPLSPWLNRPWTEVKGLPLWDVLRHREINDRLRRVLDTGQDAGGEFSLTIPGRGESVWRVAFRPFPGSGGAVLTFEDRTALRRLENLRKDFVANVSHELRTPLTALRAALETLLGGALSDAKHAREFLQTAQAQVERLQRLIDDLLILAQLDKGELRSGEARAPFQPVVGKVVKMLEPVAERHGVALIQEWPPSDIFVAISEDELSQVFMNLVDNAIKFNRSRGTVALSARVRGDALEALVRDTGIGIPPAQLPRIFERFYRVDKARSRDLGGTGLGLAIVKHIVENRGGRVQVESVPDQGSTFTLTLPLAS